MNLKKEFEKEVEKIKKSGKSNKDIEAFILQSEEAIKSIDSTYESVKIHASVGMNIPDADPYKEDMEKLKLAIEGLKNAT